jgi:hypothetical protein
VKQAKAKKARCTMVVIGSIILADEFDAPFWSESVSLLRPKMIPLSSQKVFVSGVVPGTSQDKIQHYQSIVDRYKISEREGVDTGNNCFIQKNGIIYKSLPYF